MASTNDDFIKELREDFKIEAVEHIQVLSDLLLRLEKDAGKEQKGLIEVVFREIHSLKGASRAVNLLHIEQLCMALENVFHQIKDEKLVMKAQMFDVFFKAHDLLQAWVSNIDATPNDFQSTVVQDVLNELDGFINKEKTISRRSLFFELDDEQSNQNIGLDLSVTENEALSEPVDQVVSNDDLLTPQPVSKSENIESQHTSSEKETIRIPISRLTELLRKADELVVLKNMLQFQLESLNDIQTNLSQWYIKQIKSEQKLSNSHAESLDYFRLHLTKLGKLNVSFSQLERSAAKDIDALLFDVKRTLLQPFAQLTAIVPKLVRDLSKLYNKDVELHLNGIETEVDRRILETLKDPLIHLVRNAIDHGIETKAERQEKQKEEKANLWISMQQGENQKLRLIIRDDGRGINKKKLINSALKHGIISEEDVEKLTDQETMRLIFSSGVSTTDFITDISGRGLGMAIVVEKVNEIGGAIEVESQPDRGTSFLITLPQTLASFRGILIEAAGQRFLVPTQSILAAKRYLKSSIQLVEARSMIVFENEQIAVQQLADILGLRIRRTVPDKFSYVRTLLLTDGHHKLAIVVDTVLGEFEGVLKTFGPQLKHVQNFSGAVLMGDGRVVPVLNPAELIKTSVFKTGTLVTSASNESYDNEKSERNILIAEDSITVRNMLRNILENAGFVVKSAVDGQDALEFLNKETFDLVVSDVEMPRMNGFELTRSIKNNPVLSEIPVVLVTALESSEDKQKGLEAGANAYIVKGSFEKSNLIETINRLI